MNTSSPNADDASTTPAPDEPEGINPSVVRSFLILAFGLAFGIEGMALVRSYLFNGEEEAAERVEHEEGEQKDDDGETTPLRMGDDLPPATTVSERVAEIQVRAQSGGPWVFRLAVTVVNDGKNSYRLSLRDLKADDGAIYDDVQSVACPLGDPTQLVATRPIGADARPAALTAEVELQLSNDSTRVVRRRILFGHAPVRMQR